MEARGDTKARQASTATRSRNPCQLLDRLAALYGLPVSHVLATRGSDEAIDLLSRIYLDAGADAILQCTPTFGMYRCLRAGPGRGGHRCAPEPRAGLEPRARAPAGRVAPARQARVSVLPEQSDRQSARPRRRGSGGAARSTARPSWCSTRPTSNGRRRRACARSARAPRHARHPAHPLQGARARRRAHRRPARAPGHDRARATHHPSLLALRSRPSRRRCGRSNRGEVAASQARIETLLAEREYLRAPPVALPLGREGLAERCEFPAGRVPRRRPVHERAQGRRRHRARSARQSRPARVAAHLGRHACAERRAPRQPGGDSERPARFVPGPGRHPGRGAGGRAGRQPREDPSHARRRARAP